MKKQVLYDTEGSEVGRVASRDKEGSPRLAQ